MHVGRTSENLPRGVPAPLSSVGSEPPEQVGTASALRSDRTTAGSATHPFLQLLRGLGQELDRGENIAAKAIRGAGGHASLSPETLIALQAGIYRYSEALDLVTKLVDRGTQAVRTTRQNQ
jgi:hypothetical protein